MTSKPQFAGERVRLGDIANVTTGNVAPKASDFSEEGIPFVRAGSLSGLIKNGDYDTLDKVDEPTAKQLKLKLFPAGTVLFAKSGMSCLKGYVYTLKRPCYVVSHLACVTPKGSTSTFLQYYFKYNRPNRLIENPSFPSIKLSKISEIEIAIPDERTLSAQTAVLDKINEQTAITQEQISRLDILVKSRFVEMFGTTHIPSYPVIPIEDACTAIVDCPHETPKYEGELVHPAIRTSELLGTVITWDSMKYVSEEEYLKRIQRMKPLAGDIVYAREGSYGNAAVLPDGHEFCLGQRTMLFRPNRDVCLANYLLYALTSMDVKRQADELNVGSTVPHVNVRDARRFSIPLPPMNAQQEFSVFVQQVDKLRVVAEEQKKKLQTLYDSLAQEYFAI